MRVEESTSIDKVYFRAAWQAMLRETSRLQDPVEPMSRTVQHGYNLFNAYLEGNALGMCQIVKEEHTNEPVGFALWGDDLGDTPGLDPYCTIWGLYITPEHRGEKLSGYVADEARKAMIGLDYEGAQWTVNSKNDPCLAAGKKFATGKTIMSMFYRTDF